MEPLGSTAGGAARSLRRRPCGFGIHIVSCGVIAIVSQPMTAVPSSSTTRLRTRRLIACEPAVRPSEQR